MATNLIELPHFDWPPRLDASGKFVVVEQNSPADVGACVTNVVVCPVGALLGNPTFGTPSVLFQTEPINMQAILTAVQRIEPRAATLSMGVVTDAIQAGIQTVLGLYPDEGLYPRPGLYPQTTSTISEAPDLSLGINVGVADTSVTQSSDGS